MFKELKRIIFSICLVDRMGQKDIKCYIPPKYLTSEDLIITLRVSGEDAKSPRFTRSY